MLHVSYWRCFCFESFKCAIRIISDESSNIVYYCLTETQRFGTHFLAFVNFSLLPLRVIFRTTYTGIFVKNNTGGSCEVSYAAANVTREGHNTNGFRVSRFRDTLRHTQVFTHIKQTLVRHRYGTLIQTYAILEVESKFSKRDRSIWDTPKGAK